MNTNKILRREKKRLNDTFGATEWQRRQTLYKPFKVFVMLMPYMTTESVGRLAIIPPPRKIGKHEIPQDLQMVTFGTLTKLQNTAKSNDFLKVCCELVSVLTGESAERVASRPAIEVIGTVNMVQTEMERIGKLFQSLGVEHTSDEVAAGIDKLEFGTFGIVDWYAKRMGIIDHEEVFNTPWARIFQCMKIDHENNEFEKRYRQILERRIKRK